MQQSSATQSLHLSFWELRKIVACSHSSSQCLLVSIVFGTVTSLHPTSFLMIFILVVQWNTSNLDTIGPEESVLISEVSLFQEYTNMVLGEEESVLFREVSLFQGSKSIQTPYLEGGKCPV